MGNELWTRTMALRLLMPSQTSCGQQLNFVTVTWSSFNQWDTRMNWYIIIFDNLCNVIYTFSEPNTFIYASIWKVWPLTFEQYHQQNGMDCKSCKLTKINHSDNRDSAWRRGGVSPRAIPYYPTNTVLMKSLSGGEWRLIQTAGYFCAVIISPVYSQYQANVFALYACMVYFCHNIKKCANRH